MWLVFWSVFAVVFGSLLCALVMSISTRSLSSGRFRIISPLLEGLRYL